jgi:hypothetical protein
MARRSGLCTFLLRWLPEQSKTQVAVYRTIRREEWEDGAVAAAAFGLAETCPVSPISKDRTEKAKDRLVADLRLLQVRRVSC